MKRLKDMTLDELTKLGFDIKLNHHGNESKAEALDALKSISDETSHDITEGVSSDWIDQSCEVNSHRVEIIVFYEQKNS